VRPIIKVSSVRRLSGRLKMEKVRSEPLASYPVIWEFRERSDETLCGSVPHLIVSSDTKRRPYEGDAKN
jgi:hypothetical protein